MKKDKFKKEEWKSFYEGQYAHEFQKQSIKRLERLLPLFELKKSDEILDIGCGDGMLLDIIYDKIGRYTGIDFSRPFITYAKKKAVSLGVTNAHFYCGDIVEFCSNNQSTFDKAFTMDFSEHVTDEDFILIYTSILGSLKNDGILYIHTPNGDYFLELLKKWGVIHQFPEHISVRNGSEYIRLLGEVGFHDIVVQEIAHYNILKYLHYLSYLPLVGKFGKARLFMTCKKR